MAEASPFSGNRPVQGREEKSMRYQAKELPYQPQGILGERLQAKKALLKLQIEGL